MYVRWQCVHWTTSSGSITRAPGDPLSVVVGIRERKGNEFREVKVSTQISILGVAILVSRTSYFSRTHNGHVDHRKLSCLAIVNYFVYSKVSRPYVKKEDKLSCQIK